MYDTSPTKNGRIVYINAVFRYLKDEYMAYNGEPLPDQGGWEKVRCGEINSIVPKQDATGNNCGVFTCLIMELLMNKIDPWILNDSQWDVDTLGRFALFHAIKFNKPVFQHCFSPSHLTLERWMNGPYKWDQLFPLTSILMDRDSCKVPYIEELSYHFSRMTTNKPVVSSLTPLPEPWEFKFEAPKLNDGVDWDYDPLQRIVIGKFTGVTNIHWRHKQFLGQIMERDDLTLIMEGLVSDLCASMADLKLLLNKLLLDFGDQTYHNFRKFDRIEEGGFVHYRARENVVFPMRVKDYVHYLSTLMGDTPTATCSYQNEAGQDVALGSATDVALYMLDIDMTKHLLSIEAAFESEYKMKEVLPGGKWCMTHQVSCTCAD